MKRRTRTTCLAFTLGTLALLARGQNPAPLSPPPTVEQAAGQQSNLPELTLEQAVEQAVAMIAGLYNRAQRRAYRTTILLVFDGSLLAWGRPGQLRIKTLEGRTFRWRRQR